MVKVKDNRKALELEHYNLLKFCYVKNILYVKIYDRGVKMKIFIEDNVLKVLMIVIGVVENFSFVK